MSEEKVHPNVARVTQAARGAGLEIEVRKFPEGTKTAQDAADAIGVTVGQIVKSLVFGVDDEIVMALVSGVNQLDEKKLAAAAGGAKCKRVDADAVREATGYAIGGVPPFGHSTQLRVFVDPDLLLLVQPTLDEFQPKIFLVSVYYSAQPHLIPTVYICIFKLKFNIYFCQVLKLL